MGNANTLQNWLANFGFAILPAFLFEHFLYMYTITGVVRGVLYTNHAIAPELETSCLLVPNLQINTWWSDKETEAGQLLLSSHGTSRTSSSHSLVSHIHIAVQQSTLFGLRRGLLSLTEAARWNVFYDYRCSTHRASHTHWPTVFPLQILATWRKKSAFWEVLMRQINENDCLRRC